jgi:hypothetical protein
MRIEGNEVTLYLIGVMALVSAIAASSNNRIQRTTKSVTIFCYRKNRASFSCSLMRAFSPPKAVRTAS